MKNYVQNGDMVYSIAPTGGVKSGDGVLIGASLFGVAGADAAAGETFALWCRGIFTLPKASAVWAAGDAIYWDNTAKNLTKTTTSNVLVGVATKAVATAGTLIGEIRLV